MNMLEKLGSAQAEETTTSKLLFEDSKEPLDQRVTILLPKSTLRTLKFKALEEETTVSDMIRESINTLLNT